MHYETHSELCSGCNTCRVACGLANFKEVNPAKAALNIVGQFPGPGTYSIHFCDQCGACADACPVEAIGEHDGIYLVAPETCIGCSACVDACPHGVMVLHDDSEVPFKCTSCGECAEVCPRDAIVKIG